MIFKKNKKNMTDIFLFQFMYVCISMRKEKKAKSKKDIILFLCYDFLCSKRTI